MIYNQAVFLKVLIPKESAINIGLSRKFVNQLKSTKVTLLHQEKRSYITQNSERKNWIKGFLTTHEKSHEFPKFIYLIKTNILILNWQIMEDAELLT